MADAIFLRLDERFALGADDQEWVVYRSRQKNPPALDAPLIPKDWEPINFVGSTKAILVEVLREKGCSPVFAAERALAGYPDTFRAWKAAVSASNAILETAE
jgi:hypothetical protein